jgi:hypothetical protein
LTNIYFSDIIKSSKERKFKKMFENEKTALTMNIIFFLPLLIINFFCYGIDGDIGFIEVVRKDFKKAIDK